MWDSHQVKIKCQIPKVELKGEKEKEDKKRDFCFLGEMLN